MYFIDVGPVASNVGAKSCSHGTMGQAWSAKEHAFREVSKATFSEPASR